VSAAEPEARFSVASLSDAEEVPLSFAPDLGWKPLRHLLGIRAFGMNAYIAHAAGSQLIEEHDELGGNAGGHEEVYFVVSGHARFAVAGEELDGPAGTFVAVHDPAARRSAVAVEAGTVALAIGARPGLPFEVSAWEYTFRADAAARAGRTDEATDIVREGLAGHPDDASLLYNAACYESLAGRVADALLHLRRAVELDPRYAEYAAGDTDLDALRAEPDFPRP
jgi:tetratricopeptide (TPR) repeat protein